MSHGNKSVLISIEEEMLLNTRRILFREKISVQEFCSFVMHRLVLEDPSALDLLNKAIRFKLITLEKEEGIRLSKVNPNALYDFFEQQDEKKEEDK